ncbi:MAG TPA: helix-hairpin-helix domain-containing protein, partial [Tissierellales bacterium]|nr:helix-hairpin-helix domain-containing protein [Tissierellales bacterium]
ILNNDVKALCTAPGVGKKTANRMILELKDRIDDNIIIGEEPVSVKTDNYHDALYGLISLGYTRNEATRVLSKLEINNMAAEDIIRVALNKLSKK